MQGGTGGAARRVPRSFKRLILLWELDPFDEDEVCALLHGDGSRFGIDDLKQNVRLEHGYTRKSPEIQMLFEVLSEFNVEQQRRVAILKRRTGSMYYQFDSSEES
jgi:hypothetical protein